MRHPTLAALVALFAASAVSAEVRVVEADRIHTMDPARPIAEAFAYDTATGRITAVGTRDALQKQFAGAPRVAAAGKTIVPGLIDAHAHILNLGLALMQADLVDTKSKAEVIERLRAFEKDLPKDAWLLGRGWDQNDWPGDDKGEHPFPTTADLDAAFPDRPVWIERIDGHASWANTAALKRVERDLGGEWQPDGGKIIRANGKPTGIFVDAAVSVVDAVVPRPSEAVIDEGLDRAFAAIAKAGLTGIHDMGVSRELLAIYRRRADEKRLPIRVYAYANGDDAALDDLCKNGLYEHPSGRLEMRGVKLYADGALGSRGAALLEPYHDDPNNTGLLVTDEKSLDAAIAKAARCKVQVATHAIGDRGNRVALDLYAKHIGAAGESPRWRIEHAQVVAPADFAKFGKHDIIASMQPTHATSDMPWAEQRVGPARIVGAYAWRTMRDQGIRLAFGSDFPVESVDPLLGLRAAITRQDAQGQPAGGWYPNEAVSPYEALRGFTTDAAYAGFAEGELGVIREGARADFVVLAKDLVAPGARIEPGAVLETWVDGARVDGVAAK